MSLDFSPSIVQAFEQRVTERVIAPQNLCESLFYRAIRPDHSEFIKTVHLVALSLLAAALTIATWGLFIPCVFWFISTYIDYRDRVNHQMEILPHKISLFLELRPWIANGGPEEERQDAANRILECFEKNETDLDLSGLNLSDLPSAIGKLTQLTVLDLRENDLTTLPEEMKQLTQLQFLDVKDNGFSFLPDFIQVGMIVEIEMDGFSLIDRLYIRLGLRTFFDRDLDPSKKTTFREVCFAWQCLLSEREWPDFAILEEESTEAFLEFLCSLTETEEFFSIRERNAEKERTLFAERVMRILCGMEEHEVFRKLALEEAAEAVVSCEDGVELGSKNIETHWHVHIGSKAKTSLELAILAIGLRRLNLIKSFAHIIAGANEIEPKRDGSTTYQAEIDAVEPELYLQIQLSDALKLPVTTQLMKYKDSAGVQPQELIAIEENIKKSTSAEKEIMEILLTQKFWRPQLRNENTEIYDKIVDETKALKVYEGRTLSEDEKKGLLNERLENRYLEDTRKWYRANREVLAKALNCKLS